MGASDIARATPRLFFSIVYGCRPESRGYLTLKSANPDDAPAMHPNYLSAEQDVVDIRNGFRETRRYFHATGI